MTQPPDHRVNAKREPPTPAQLELGFRFGEWSVIPAENLIRRDDRRIRLEPKVMRLLLTLVASHDRPCTRSELLAQLWPSLDTGESALTRAVYELRKAFGDERRKARYIETIQGIGYKAIAPIRPLVRQRRGPTQAPPPMSQAEELIARARYLLVRRNREDIRLAVDLLQEHLKTRPDHSQASALLAYAKSIDHLYTDDPPALNLRRAREHAERALDLDGANGVAWAVLGALAHDQWRWSEALEHYERAHAYEPTDPLVLHGFAELLLHLGDIKRAQAMMRQACQLQATAASAHLIHGWMLIHGEERQARLELSKARQLGAKARFCDNLECLLLHREGWNEAGIQRWKQLNDVRIGHPEWMWPNYLIDHLIDSRSPSAVVTNIRERVRLGHLDPGIAPFMLTVAGALDAAFEVADLAIEQRRFFIIDPWLDEMEPFRQDPRFADVQRAVGLGAVRSG